MMTCLRNRNWVFFLIALTAWLSSCASQGIFIAAEHTSTDSTMPGDDELHYRAYLVGDAGGEAFEVMHLLREQLEEETKDAAVIFLGDNIYPEGMPDSTDALRTQSELRIGIQLAAVRDFPGEVFFIPGNHDWGDGHDKGLEAVRRQEAYVEEALDRGNVWLPDDGYPGPVEVKLSKRLRLVAIDTQWWLQRGERPFGETDGYDLDQPFDFIVELDDIVKRNRDRDLLIVGHHPLYSAGNHGGNFSVKEHLFPLTALSPTLYVPLPILGSLYPLYVRFVGGRQDLAHPRYKSLRKALERVFSHHEDMGLFYASGHDHNLQWFAKHNDQHYIISGGGYEAKYVSGRGNADFAASRRGFVRLHYFKDGSVWMEVWSPDQEKDDGLLFRKELRGPLSEYLDPLVAEVAEPVNYADSTVSVSANPGYAAKGLKRIVMGSHNRSAWDTPVEVPIIDLSKKKGGLTPLKRGGGMQTKSLRLEDPDGRQYVLRSIDKDPSKTVPENLQGSMVTDIVQDQIAAIHPFGAFIIPKLADAVGIYHTNPELVFVPDDPRLGIYREQFGNTLMMFEDRPNNDMSHEPSYGRAPDVISASKLYREINDDNDHRVDQRAYLRARLFDILLSDWDRHKDQWRWAAFEPEDKEGKIYRPIPRDRDWAFNNMNGIMMSIYRQLDARFQSFKPRYGYLFGYTINGGGQDRRFTNELVREEWLEIAREIQDALTDQVVAEAINDWPESIRELDGERIQTIFRSRIDALDEVAGKIYDMYATVVDVVGSDKHERFEVTRLTTGKTHVRVYKTTKEGENRKLLYDRFFVNGETEEIRLYGLAGNDQIMVAGEVDSGPLVIAVGGADHDTFTDNSVAREERQRVMFYDTKEGNTWHTAHRTKVTRSNDPAVNEYNPHGHKPAQRLPKTFFGYNSDDGVLVGGGMQFIKHGFRKDPFSSSHTLRANVAGRTQAFNIRYDGLLVSEISAWDIGLYAAYLSPNSIRVYYGMGNETEELIEDASFYESRLTWASFKPFATRGVGDGLNVRIGPKLEYIKAKKEEDRNLAQLPLQEGISPGTFDDQVFSGISFLVDVRAVDNLVYPTSGMRWENELDVSIGLNSASDNFVSLTSDFAFYISPPEQSIVTFAGRIGGGHIFGTFPYFMAQTLGQKNNLRGHRSTRFAGRTSLYQNFEMRAKVLNFSTYAAVGKLGVLGFIDNGRVWTDGERSRMWHQGYGGGIWASFFDVFAVSGMYGRSKEDSRFMLKLGFLY